MSFVVAVIGLGFLIFVHELGHFSASLALRMRPRRFYIGFPPPLWKTHRKGIEYGIGAIPLGGFVKIPGMHRPAPSDVDTHFARVVTEAPELAGPLARLREALAAGEMEEARSQLSPLRSTLESLKLTPAAAQAAEKGLTERDDALGSDAYWRAPTWKRIVVIAAGPMANIVLAVVLLTGLFLAIGGKATTTVDAVAPKSPAAAAGLQPGDRVIAINGQRVGPSQISATITNSKGKALVVTVLRNGEVVRLRPVSARPVEGDGYRLGFVLRGEGLSPLGATKEALRVTGLVTKEIGASLTRLVTGSGRKEISSPVGIVQGSSEAAKQGVDSYIWVLALISLSLALINLLPLLPLDGGHIAFAIVEGIRGRSVGREVYEKVSVIGIAIVLLLFFIGLTNDIGRLS
jgi:regulator of sigma E protease